MAESDDHLSADNPSSYKNYVQNEPQLSQQKTVKKRDTTFDKYINCARNEAVKYSKSNEPADTVAKTAVIACNDPMMDGLQSTVYWNDLSANGKAEGIRKLEELGERVALKTVMDARLK